MFPNVCRLFRLYSEDSFAIDSESIEAFCHDVLSQSVDTKKYKKRFKCNPQADHEYTQIISRKSKGLAK